MYQEKIQRKTAAGPSYDWSGCDFQVKVQWTEGLRFQGFSVFLLTFAAFFPVDAGFQLFFSSVIVTVPRERDTIPSFSKYFSIRETTSRALPRFRAICSWVV